jgi:hypothetical protein
MTHILNASVLVHASDLIHVHLAMLQDLVDFLALLAQEFDARVRLELGRDAALDREEEVICQTGGKSQRAFARAVPSELTFEFRVRLAKPRNELEISGDIRRVAIEVTAEGR